MSLFALVDSSRAKGTGANPLSGHECALWSSWEAGKRTQTVFSLFFLIPENKQVHMQLFTSGICFITTL